MGIRGPQPRRRGRQRGALQVADQPDVRAFPLRLRDVIERPIHRAGVVRARAGDGVDRVELRAFERADFIGERRDGDLRAGRDFRERVAHGAAHRLEMRAAHAARGIDEQDRLEIAGRDFFAVGKKRAREEQREQRDGGDAREEQRPVFNPPPAPPFLNGHAQKPQRADFHPLVFPRADEMNSHGQGHGEEAKEDSGVDQAHDARG